MSTDGRRWDGRTWLARTGVASVPVFVHGASDGSAMATVVAVTCIWIPLVSLTSWWQEHHRGVVQRLVSAAVDLGALVVLAGLVPSLAPSVLVLLVPAGLLHAAGVTGAWRLLLLVAVGVAQVVAGLGSSPDPDLVRLVVVLDLTAGVLGAALLTEQDRHRRRSSAALRRADELTDAVLAGIGEAVVVTDAHGRITSTNDAVELTFGRPAAGACHDALGLHKGAGLLDCSRGCPLLDEDTGRGQAEVTRDHPNGARQSLLANVRGIRGPTGSVREVVHSYRDITAVKQAEQAKTLFLATASHELKTPVAVITGYVTLLEEGAVPEDERLQAVRTIRSRTEQLSQIIERLLLASRIEGGGLTLTTDRLDVTPIVHDRVAALREALARDIVVEQGEDLPEVDGDETAVATVLDHLIENAAKYSPDGGRITVTTAVTDTTVDIEVADEGVGMSPRDAEHCFDAFWQAESADTRRFGGSGVGLYIVRSMSRAMGGETSVVRAVPGEGTTFRFTLRRADVAPPARVDPDEGTRTMMDEFMRQVGVGGDR